MMKNKKGSILIITIGFVFVFTLLGFGSLHYAYVQNDLVEKEKASAEAFWMADGALQMAYERLVSNPTDLIARDNYTPNNGDLEQYDVFSEEDSCPPPLCSSAARATDPELPVCTKEERSQDPILCDSADRPQDPALCDPATRIPDLSDCTAEDRLLDPDGLGRCPCEVNGSCTMYCPCHYGDPACVGRCPCEYAEEDLCMGRCPCEITDPPSCPCDATDTCPPNMIGRCPCEVIGSCCVSWNLQSYGEVNYRIGVESRAIKAKVSVDYGDSSIDNALETWGDVNKDRDCVPDGNSEIDGGCEQQSEFTFETVFNQPKQWFIDNATHTYVNPDNNFPGVVEGITVITLTGNNKSLNITEDKQAYDADGIPIASLLIIDTTGVDPNKNVMLTIGGNGVFRGIIWIIGEAQIVGTSTIRGAIFIAGDDEDYTKVSGTTDVYWDPYAIREAVDSFDGTIGNEGYSDSLKLTSWQEIDTNKADY